MLSPKLERPRGSALILALLIMALTAGLSTLILVQTKSLLNLTQRLVRGEQAYWLAQGVPLWAIHTLGKNPQETITYTDGQGTTVHGYIADLQAKFNINNLSNEIFAPDFKRLLHAVDKTLTQEQIEAITVALMDYLTSLSSPDNSSSVYSKAQPPYRAAYRLLADKSELMRVQFITPQLYQALAPYIVALPEPSTQININTASIPVLLSLNANLTLEKAKAIVALREQQPFSSSEDFLQRTGMRAQGTDLSSIAAKIVVQSEYLQVVADAKSTHSQAQQLSLIQVKPKGQPTIVLSQIFLPQSQT
jgi:general secretion pathway protein K